MKIKIQDPKFRGGSWVKKYHATTSGNGRYVDVHWFENLRTGRRTQIKIAHDTKYPTYSRKPIKRR